METFTWNERYKYEVLQFYYFKRKINRKTSLQKAVLDATNLIILTCGNIWSSKTFIFPLYICVYCLQTSC